MKAPKKKRKPAWLSILQGLDPSRLTLDQLRDAKRAYGFLTERFDGPPGIGEYMRAYRFLLLFGIACVVENKHPPLTRCWKDLEKLFMGDPAFADGIVVQSWILMDFHFGPKGETALDYVEQFLAQSEMVGAFKPFITAARKSRLGLHEDIGRTKTTARFRELLSGKVTSAFPSVPEYGNVEILLTRMIAHGDQVFIWGDPRGFPKETKTHLEDMVLGKLFYFAEDRAPEEQFEAFMKLAGPYWMSCTTNNEAAPILGPDHYLTYLDRA